MRKEKAVPPPRQSSNPVKQSVSPPKTDPLTQLKQASFLESTKVESPKLKHKVSNGTLPQSMQVPIPVHVAQTQVMPTPVPVPKDMPTPVPVPKVMPTLAPVPKAMPTLAPVTLTQVLPTPAPVAQTQIMHTPIPVLKVMPTAVPVSKVMPIPAPVALTQVMPTPVPVAQTRVLPASVPMVQTQVAATQPIIQTQVATKATEPSKVSNTEEILPQAKDQSPPKGESTESNGVGDKIRKFERAAEDATVGRTSRPGSVRGKVQERSSSQGSNPSIPEKTEEKQAERPEDSSKVFSPTSFAKWRKEGSETPTPALKSASSKAEEKETKPAIKFNKFPQDLPVKFPSNAKNQDCKPSNTPPDVTSPTQAPHKMTIRKETEQSNDDVNTHGTFKTCKFKPKEKQTPHKAPSAYYTRGTEEIWLVKKKDIQEIEDRVMESFRRAGAGSCRSEPIREFPSEGPRNVPFAGSNATLGRTKRMYARSESLDPQHAARSQTLKRQSSVACTCGHDKKSRSKSSGNSTPVSETGAPRPRSRSHGDDHSQAHILDKYETLV